ncbi:MAG TPA: aldo/keto reductase [Micromonosporaceae bacterium]|jgi:aryl-alcohol dehydrogenase-like predicted oxidoreductase
MPSTTAAAAGTWTLGDLTVNRMGFGSMRLTPNPDREVAIRVLRHAIELGVNHIDTAAFYMSPGGVLDVGSGTTRYATELIAEALWPYPDDLVITTKVGPGEHPERGFHHAKNAADLRMQIEENLRRLRRDHLDVVNLRIIPKRGEDSIEERFAALAAMRDEGLIRHLGLSAVREDHLDEAKDIAPVVCVQNPYSIDVQRPNDGLVDVCGERGIAFVPFFAIAGDRREAGAAETHGEAVEEVAKRHGATPQQIRLAWTLHKGPHVLAIPGTGDPEHLEQNVAAASIRLTAEDLQQLA